MSKKSSKTKGKPGKNLISNAIMEVFTKNSYKSYNFRQLSKVLGLNNNTDRELVKNSLAGLVESFEIIEMNTGKYKLNPAHIKTFTTKPISGIVDMKQTGKAYIISDQAQEDIYIAPNNTYHALNGDKVKVRLFPLRKGKKVEGEIVEIIERNKKQFVGIVEISKNYAFLIPDDNTVPVDIYIQASGLKGARNGNKAVAIITDWPEHSKNPFGEIIEVLGNPGEHEVEMKSILADFDFPLRFPEKVVREADEIPVKITDSEIRRRKDFRNIFTITIDPQDAKDFDDAISLQKLHNGNWEVGVHIADVSHYVKSGTAIDKEAYERGTSIYLVDRVIPMLPEKLSNEVCSLKAGEDKLCYAAIFEMDDKANVLTEWYGRTLINSDFRFNYDEVQEIIEGKSHEYHENILILHQLASLIREARFKKGAIAFTSQEVKFILDDNHKPVGAYIKEQMDSNRLIEDFMLLANKKVAEKIGKTQGHQSAKTFVYRIHDVPNPEKLQTFSDFVNKLGYKLNLGSRKTLSSSLNHLFTQIKGKGEENMIENIAVRTMAKAEYSINNIGHYGLAFSHYTHFTSPIRRYPDLMVHRLFDQYLNEGSSVNPVEYEEKCKHSSEMERKALQAERASVKYKQAEYLLDKIGQEFNGLISGVSKWGIFVELDGNKCEGMISLRYLNDDFYYLDDENYRVIGHQTGREFKLGDPIRIRVRRIDLAKKQMDFDLA
jgi:ribonuclease R